MKNIFVFLVLLIISGLSPPSNAQALSYTFVSVNYGRFFSKIDGVSGALKGNGYTIDLSYAVRPYVAITAGYSIAEVNTAQNDLNADIDATSLGILVHFPVNEKSDLIIIASFVNGKADVSINGGDERSVDADGGVVALGFRAMAYKDIEISGLIRKNSIQDKTSISIDLAAAYYVFDTVSIDAGYLVDSKDGSDLLTLGLTKYF